MNWTLHTTPSDPNYLELYPFKAVHETANGYQATPLKLSTSIPPIQLNNPTYTRTRHIILNSQKNAIAHMTETTSGISEEQVSTGTVTGVTGL